MINKRLIGVITVKDDIAVQSFGYNKYLPLGSPEIIAKNLDRWGADEILINVIDRSINKYGPDFDLLKKIQKIQINTPLIYGGGISNLEDARRVINSGADRLLIENLLYEDFISFKKISHLLGAQALIISVPVSSDFNKNILQFNYLKKTSNKINKNFLSALNQKLVSEILLIDFMNEGYDNSFNLDILDINNHGTPLLCFGGIKDDKLINKISSNKKVAAIAIGNSLNYSETKIQNIKKKITKNNFRKPIYKIC